jgi:hypothetical protein
MNEFLTSRELVNRETVHRLVDELFDLQDRTDPRACVAPEAIEFRGDVIGKDAAAERAVGIASLIFFRPRGMGREPSSGSSRVHQFGAASAVGRPYSRDSWRGIALFSRPCGPRGGNHVPRLAALIFGAVFNVGAGRWFFLSGGGLSFGAGPRRSCSAVPTGKKRATRAPALVGAAQTLGC